MNTPEKTVNLYLRLNGFFTMPHFTTLGEKDYRHTDILAVRLPGSIEQVRGIRLELDTSFFEFLGKEEDEIIPLVAEVKGGSDEHGDRSEIVEYVKSVFGEYGDDLLYVEFVRKTRKRIGRDTKEYPLDKCLDFILGRLDSTQAITSEVGGLTKSGSWTWSEDFLSDLLYLKRLAAF